MDNHVQSSFKDRNEQQCQSQFFLDMPQVETATNHGAHDRVATAQLRQWLQFAMDGIHAMVAMLAMVNERNGAIVAMVASAPRSTSSQKSHCLYTNTT
jgi:hypothetical protein